MTDREHLHWWSSPRTLLRYILMLDDTPHSIALGTAVGMFIGLTPTVGIQMILVMVFAFLVSPFFRFNRVAALVTVYISNPVTLVPIYWTLYKVGRVFVDGHLTRDDLSRILEYDNFADWWQTVVSLSIDVGASLLVGTAIVATVGGVVTYPVMCWLLGTFRKPARPAADPEKETLASAAESPTTPGGS